MARPKSDPITRFLAKVKEMESGCIEWQAGLARGGYGKFQLPNKTVTAHRFAYESFVGSIPDGLCVLHRCDNRKCTNPDHLFIGTIKENIADMDNKHRRKTRAVLDIESVKVIKQMLNDRYSQREIAEKFGVDQTTISRIKLNKTQQYGIKEK